MAAKKPLELTTNTRVNMFQQLYHDVFSLQPFHTVSKFEKNRKMLILGKSSKSTIFEQFELEVEKIKFLQTCAKEDYLSCFFEKYYSFERKILDLKGSRPVFYSKKRKNHEFHEIWQNLAFTKWTQKISKSVCTDTCVVEMVTKHHSKRVELEESDK